MEFIIGRYNGRTFHLLPAIIFISGYPNILMIMWFQWYIGIAYEFNLGE